MPRGQNLIETESRLVTAMEWGERNGLTAQAYRSYFWSDENVLKLDNVEGYPTL
jgi:hypothetical protein